jgi:hypothetical protein
LVPISQGISVRQKAVIAIVDDDQSADATSCSNEPIQRDVGALQCDPSRRCVLDLDQCGIRPKVEN